MIIGDLQAAPAGTALLDCEVRDGKYAFVLSREDSQIVQFDDWSCPVPRRLRYPVIRLIDKRTAVLLDRISSAAGNAWLIKHGAGIVEEFVAGKAISGVVVISDVIAVTYNDEGLSVAPSQEGIAFFSIEGKFVWGYNSEFGSTAGHIWDCYCAAEGPDGRLWFDSYGELPLVGLDCHARTQELVEAPAQLCGPNALSTDGSSFWFFSPNGDEHGVFKWTRGAVKVDRVGEFDGRLRGLPDGTFITVSNTGYRFVQVAA